MLRTLHTGFCAMLVLAIGCTESFRPDVSTETGNPPIIDSDKVALVVTSDEVHVQGEPGAVTPPEGEIEVTILRNQEVARGPVAGDGSFDVEVDATLDDVFEVRAVNGEQRSRPVIVLRGGAQVGEGDGGVLSCEQKSEYAREAVQQAIANADRSCETTDDCQIASPDSACFAGCGFDYVSADGQASISAVVAALDNGFCADFEDGCDRIIPPCVPPEPGECHNGQCYPAGEFGEIVDGGAACDACLTSDFSWRITGAGTLPALPSQDVYTVSGCGTFDRVSAAGERCSSEVPCEGSADVATMRELIALLQGDEVSEAFASGGSLGWSQELRGYTYELTLGDQTYTYGSCAPGMECEASDLERIIDLMERLTAQQTCETPQPDCTSPYQDGDCDAAFLVYWHNPETGMCELKQYGGCGGNGNRYDSAAACAAACSEPLACPPNRMNVQDCFECGLGGGCMMMGEYCALICSNDADCESDPGAMGAGTTCNEEQSVCVSVGICI